MMTIAFVAMIVGMMAHGNNAAVGIENSSTMTAEKDLFFGDNNNDGPERQLYIKQSGVETDEIRDAMFALSSNAPVATSKSANLVVDPDDFIMRKDSWDGSPIVMEPWKLIFFPIFDEGYTTWKQLFRRMMQHPDWYVNAGHGVLVFLLMLLLLLQHPTHPLLSIPFVFFNCHHTPDTPCHFCFSTPILQ